MMPLTKGIVICVSIIVCMVALAVFTVAFDGFGIEARGKERRQEMERQCMASGAEAFEAGIPANANPYTYQYQRTSWLDGWMQAQKESQK